MFFDLVISNALFNWTAARHASLAAKGYHARSDDGAGPGLAGLPRRLCLLAM